MGKSGDHKKAYQAETRGGPIVRRTKTGPMITWRDMKLCLEDQEAHRHLTFPHSPFLLGHTALVFHSTLHFTPKTAGPPEPSGFESLSLEAKSSLVTT